MRKELDNQLCKKYPKIFADRHKPMTLTAMCWGFDHGDGWYQILDSLCSQIQRHIDWQNRNEVEVAQVVATQVKEKFGGLRFYYNGGDDYIDGMVRMAESWAANTCEVCGKPGKLRGGGWLYTACDEHTKPEDLETENTNE
jgi:hypothetical protein